MNSSVDRPLSGRLILVTGAGAGIGKAAAMTYAKAGATVILVGRTQSRLEALYDEIVSAGWPEPIIHPLDFATASAEDFTLLGDTLLSEFGPLYGLLHNASLLGSLGPVQFSDPASWQEIMQVNVNAAFLLTRAVLPALQQADEARILLTSSSVGRRGRAYWGAYAVSKFATEGFMQVLAEELADTTRIRVNSINPGATRTEMRRAAYPAEDPNTLPTPESLMPAYLYLMLPESQALHGQALDIRELLKQPECRALAERL